MTITKKILLWAVLMLPVTMYSQAPKWLFSSAEMRETNKQTGKVLVQKTLNSEKEIPDEVYFLYIPLEMEFSGQGEDSVIANVQLRGGRINALVLQNDNAQVWLSSVRGEALSQRQLLAQDRQNLAEIIRFSDVKQSEKGLTLQYPYVYVSGKENQIIDGLMTINYRQEEAKPRTFSKKIK